VTTEGQLNVVNTARLTSRSGMLCANCIHVWIVAVDVAGRPLAALYGLLSKEERERAASFGFDLHRDRFVACHGMLRIVLSQYVRCSPKAIEFCLEGNGVQFNLSHFEDSVLIAVTAGASVGVDLESVRELPDMTQVACHCFSESEVAALSMVEPKCHSMVFFTCWTRKEAFVKATSEGLSRHLNSFSVSVDPDIRSIQMDGVPAADSIWRLHHLMLGQKLCGFHRSSAN
jgi:4'-phosphopantetheinyl transferase